MPRAHIARIHRRIAPCVQVDIVGVRFHICFVIDISSVIRISESAR